MKVACWHKGVGKDSLWSEKTVIEQIKMLCLSNKKEITEIKSSCTKFLKMVIAWAIFAALISKCAAASASFCFCSSEK